MTNKVLFIHRTLAKLYKTKTFFRNFTVKIKFLRKNKKKFKFFTLDRTVQCLTIPGLLLLMMLTLHIHVLVSYNLIINIIEQKIKL